MGVGAEVAAGGQRGVVQVERVDHAVLVAVGAPALPVEAMNWSGPTACSHSASPCQPVEVGVGRMAATPRRPSKAGPITGVVGTAVGAEGAVVDGAVLRLDPAHAGQRVPGQVAAVAARGAGSARLARLAQPDGMRRSPGSKTATAPGLHPRPGRRHRETPRRHDPRAAYGEAGATGWASHPRAASAPPRFSTTTLIVPRSRVAKAAETMARGRCTSPWCPPPSRNDESADLRQAAQDAELVSLGVGQGDPADAWGVVVAPVAELAASPSWTSPTSVLGALLGASGRSASGS